MTFRLSPVIEGSNYIFFDPEGFSAVGGATVSAAQLEAGDTQLASINAPGLPLSIISNQIEAGDVQASSIASRLWAVQADAITTWNDQTDNAAVWIIQ